MTRSQALKIINDRIDALIISGKTRSDEYRRLIELHRALIGR